MANGSFLGGIKSKLGFGSNDADADYDRYDDYDDYDEYDDYEDYADDDYPESRDAYMDRGVVTTRGAGVRSSNFAPLVSASDARESARKINASDGTSNRSYGRTMVDSSLPPTMTAEGTAAVSAASNSRRDGLNSLFGSADDGKKTSAGAAGASSRTSSSAGDDLLRGSMQLSMPGRRQLQVIRPKKYDDAEAVTDVLKDNDAAILVLKNVDKALMMRMLDFSFGAASALDASVEALGNGVYAICRSTGLDDAELKDLKEQGVI